MHIEGIRFVLRLVDIVWYSLVDLTDTDVNLDKLTYTFNTEMSDTAAEDLENVQAKQRG